MVRTLVAAAILLVAICVPALAQSAFALDVSPPNLTHLAIAFLGLVVAARLASDAFARRSVPVAEVQTFPRYMTSRVQYRLGRFIFILVACTFFFLLVYEHRQVIEVAPLVNGDVIPEALLKAVKDQSPSYLTVIAAMGAIYLYFLNKETQWNVLLICGT